MEIFEGDGKFFTCKDLAEIDVLDTLSFVRTHDLNDTTDLDVQRHLDKVYIVDDYLSEFKVDFDIKLVDEKVNGDVVRYHQTDNVKIFGMPLDRTELSERLKKRIREEIQGVADWKDDELNLGII